jgi:sodium-dependent phosphate transporter
MAVYCRCSCSDGKAIANRPTAFSEPAVDPRTPEEIELGNAANLAAAVTPAPLTNWQRFSKAATHGLDVDIHKVVKTDEKLHEIHESAERFEPRVEYAFSYLQVFSAICVIFAHGAGEVGYMAGPLATIWEVYRNGQLSKSVKPPIWIILIGALGLVIGLATYGYNVTRAMGVKLAKLTPTRGFAAELATAFVIMIASQYGLPTSSSQCITGAIIGVGILEGTKGVNWTQFSKQFLSWVATLFVIGLAVAAVFAQGVYSPSKIQGREITQFEDRVTNLTNNVYTDFNTSLQSYRPVAEQGLLVNLPNATWYELNNTVTTRAKAAKALIDPKKTQSVGVDDILNSLYQALALTENNTVFTLGQSNVFPGAQNICIDPSSTNLTSVPCQAPKFRPG